MITREKLRIYESLGGDIDGWARTSKLSLGHSGSLNLREPAMTDNDWHVIDEILQSLFIVQSGLAGAEFETQARARAMDAVEDEYVYQQLLQLAQSRK